MTNPARNPYTSPTSTDSPTASGFSGGAAGPTIQATSLTGLVITFALVSGLVIVTVILSSLTLSNFPEDESMVRFGGDSMLFVVIGFGISIASFVAAFVLRSSLKRQAVMQLQASGDDLPQPLELTTPLPGSAQRFLGAVSSFTIVGQALCEGPAILNAIFIMLEDNFVFLIPVVFGIAGIALQTPLPGRLKAMLEAATGD
jgi:hypothetical protein